MSRWTRDGWSTRCTSAWRPDWSSSLTYLPCGLRRLRVAERDGPEAAGGGDVAALAVDDEPGEARAVAHARPPLTRVPAHSSRSRGGSGRRGRSGGRSAPASPASPPGGARPASRPRPRGGRARPPCRRSRGRGERGRGGRRAGAGCAAGQAAGSGGGVAPLRMAAEVDAESARPERDGLVEVFGRTVDAEGRRGGSGVASDPLDDAFAEEALRPEHQHHEGQDVGEPVLGGAADERADPGTRTASRPCR